MMNILKRILGRIFKRNTVKLFHSSYPHPINIIVFKKYILIPARSLAWNTFCISGRNNTTAEFSVWEIKKHIFLRANTSDLAVFWQIFVNSEYDIKYNCDPKLIIDAGAYTGLSTVWFAHRFPEAQIIAIEPGASNYDLLKKNTEGYAHINAINSALYHKKCYLRIKDKNVGMWYLQFEEASSDEPGAMESVTLSEILEESGQNEIDILKLDIEGAEKEIFSCNYEPWLAKTKMVIIETHDRFKEGCKEALLSATRKYHFNTVTQKGENLILTREKIKQ